MGVQWILNGHRGASGLLGLSSKRGCEQVIPCLLVTLKSWAPIFPSDLFSDGAEAVGGGGGS